MRRSERALDSLNFNFCPFLRESNFTTSPPPPFILLHFLFSRRVGQNPEGGPRTSNADVASALQLPPVLNQGSNTLQMNKHLHPFCVLKPEGSSTLESKAGRQNGRKKRRAEEEGAQEKDDRWKGGSMSKMNQQQSNKAMARFSGPSHNSSDLFPPWHNYHSCSNYFPS